MWPSVLKRSNSPLDITCIVPPSNLLIVVDENKPLISQTIILFDVDVLGDTHSSRPQQNTTATPGRVPRKQGHSMLQVRAQVPLFVSDGETFFGRWRYGYSITIAHTT